MVIIAKPLQPCGAIPKLIKENMEHYRGNIYPIQVIFYIRSPYCGDDVLMKNHESQNGRASFIKYNRYISLRKLFSAQKYKNACLYLSCKVKFHNKV